MAAITTGSMAATIATDHILTWLDGSAGCTAFMEPSWLRAL